MIRWISNCSSGLISIVTLSSSSSHLSRRVRPGVAISSRTPHADRRLNPGDGAVDVHHPGRDAEKEHHDRHPGRCSQPAIDRPSPAASRPGSRRPARHRYAAPGPCPAAARGRSKPPAAPPRGPLPRAPCSGARQDGPSGPAARFRSYGGAQHQSIPAVASGTRRTIIRRRPRVNRTAFRVRDHLFSNFNRIGGSGGLPQHGGTRKIDRDQLRDAALRHRDPE